MIQLHRIKRQLALMLLLIFSFQFVQLPISMALTGGPSQPEMTGFKQAGTSDMVNLFTGDFSYNIPLFELPGPNGGYPFNLSYQSGIGMDQEASWVGLGWSLSPGAINRQMRGLPDEFNGEEIMTKMDMKSSVTVGLGVGASLEVFGNDNISLGFGLGIRYNNYSGFGYSIDANGGYGTSVAGKARGVGLNISLDSKEGVSATPSLNLGTLSTSATYNSRQGMSAVNYSISKVSASYEYTNDDGKLDSYSFSADKSNASISLASPGYSPQVSMPMWNANLAGQFKAGGSFWGVFGNGYVSGFYNRQWLKNRNEWVGHKSFGYLNYQNSVDNTDVLDFNREKDGIVTNNASNLAIPSLTYDIYSVNGQGIAAMYRPMRNDIGYVRDPYKLSKTLGASAGVDVGPAASHVGVNVIINNAESTSGDWTENNDARDRLSFNKMNVDDESRSWYFKVHGEPTAENNDFIESIGNEEAVRINLTGSGKNIKATNSITDTQGWSQTLPANGGQAEDRKQQSQSVQSITNRELLANGVEQISSYKNQYINASGATVNYNRTDPKIIDHIAGFSAISGDGLRYNYTIPAYNKTQEEHLFSATKPASGEKFALVNAPSGESNPKYKYPGTEEFLKITKTPEYAHSYLLTSILGTDYVDVTGDGVTADDLGYWVKFTYEKTTDQYKWRDPFLKAHYQKGWETDPRDDKASFTYGEKELWFLRKAETKSHIAIFETEPRSDARGVASKFQDSNQLGASTEALKEIHLYTRINANGNPIKSIKFTHDYSLCPNVYNNESPASNNAGIGKLTLKELKFEYGGVERPSGYISPYQFRYEGLNPAYDRNAYDRWGNYKPHESGDPLSNNDFPYANQDPTEKDLIDERAAAWSMSSMLLPSGSEIIIDYESDDYSHVQHLKAMQMNAIVNPLGSASSIDESADFTLSGTDPLVRFKLEQPIVGALSPAEQANEVRKYLDARTGQLFFKYKINLRGDNENKFEFIQGYVDIDFTKPMTLEQNGSGEYIYGKFSVKKEDGYNPFTLRTWQHLRTNQPELTNAGKELEDTDDVGEQVSQMKSMGSVFTQIKQMFEGFYDYCNDKGWGKTVKAGKAWVRLKSPDLIKFGGGLRVKQITMKDHWQHDEEGVYGQVYEYTDTEASGRIISSGVAAYEPLNGGEENPHRYAKKWVESVPLRADNVMFFEFPVNESYYPGPQVGYRKVKVLSLASAYKAGKEVLNIDLSDGSSLFPEAEDAKFGVTGATVHEYYTAKDFPVIADETEKLNKPHNLNFPIPLLGNVSVSHLTTSQGYSIITNNMHGQPKKISNYSQNVDGELNYKEKPISYVKYNYSEQFKDYQGQKVKVLENNFVITDLGNLRLATSAELSNNAIKKYSLSQENEFFADMREHLDRTAMGGGTINLDIAWVLAIFVPIPIPFPSFWPSVSKSENLLRTAVTNKIIYKSGMLKSVEAYDGASLITTENLEWDMLTGGVALTRVNNNFDEPVFTYKIPAYKQYAGMGAAYKNIGLTYTVTNLQTYMEDKKLYRFTPNNAIKDLLFAGDEVILYLNDEEQTTAQKAIYVGIREDEHLLYCQEAPTETDYTAKIVRSGYRNQLNVMASSVTALNHPTQDVENVNYSKTIQISE